VQVPGDKIVAKGRASERYLIVMNSVWNARGRTKVLVLVLFALAVTVAVSIVSTFRPLVSSNMSVIRQDRGGYLAASFSQERDKVVLARKDNWIVVLQLSNGQVEQELTSPVEDVCSVAYCGDESAIMFAGLDGRFGVIDCRTRSAQMVGHKDSLIHCFSGPNVDKFFFCTRMNDGSLYSLTKGEVRRQFVALDCKTYVTRVPSIEYGEASRSGTLVGINLASGTILLDTDREVEVWGNSTCTTQALAFSPNAKMFVCSGYSGGIVVIELEKFTAIGSYQVPNSRSLQRIAFSDDGQSLVGYVSNGFGNGGTFYRIELASAQVTNELRHRGMDVISFTVVRNSIVVVDRDGRVLRYTLD
jgi:hypothetical protein